MCVLPALLTIHSILATISAETRGLSSARAGTWQLVFGVKAWRLHGLLSPYIDRVHTPAHPHQHTALGTRGGHISPQCLSPVLMDWLWEEQGQRNSILLFYWGDVFSVASFHLVLIVLRSECRRGYIWRVVVHTGHLSRINATGILSTWRVPRSKSVIHLLCKTQIPRAKYGQQ